VKRLAAFGAARTASKSKQATSANVRHKENVVNGEDLDLAATVAKTNWRNWTDRPATILTPNGDWLAPSLGDLTYDRERNHRLDEEHKRRIRILSAKAYKDDLAAMRLANRPNPAEAMSLAIEAADALAASYEKGGKRFRASKEQVNARKWALYDIVEMQYPMTVRQVFYQATVKGIIAKTEQGYDTVKTELGDMRKDGDLPYGWLVDNTRRVTRAPTFNSIEEALKDTAEFFRRGLWKEA
jgi:hypothetical protein